MKKEVSFLGIQGAKALSIIILISILPLAGKSISQSPANEAPKITRIVPMDRWIDLSWKYDGNASGGFAVAISPDGKDFKTVEKVGSTSRFASVYVDSLARSSVGFSGQLHLRVAELGSDGSPLQWSETSKVRPEMPGDIEAEVRKKFNYFENKSSYNANDPINTVIFNEEQKQWQRIAAIKMYADLLKSAASTQVPRDFTIPPGVYRVQPGQMVVKDAKNLIIHAPDVEIIVDSDSSGAAFVFKNCSGVTLTGSKKKENISNLNNGSFLIIDSEQLPMSVTRILACDSEKQTIDVEVLPGYVTDMPLKERMIAYSPQGRMLNVVQMGWEDLTDLGNRRFRLKSRSLRDPKNLKSVLLPGNLLVLHNNPQHKLRTHSVYSNQGCRNMRFESIRVYSGGGAPADHGTAGQTIYRNWRLLPKPGTNRLPISTGLGQFSKNGGTFIFEDCEFGPHLDDGINLLSGMSVLGKQEGPRQIVVTGWQKPTPGSLLTFYDFFNWEKFGEQKVTEVKEVEDTAVRKLVNAFYASHRMVQNAKKAFRVTLDRDVQLNDFSMVIHSDYRADSIIVRGCLFRDQLAQIMLLQGAKYGLIENNLLLRSTGGGVSAQFAQYWWEGPMPSNFMIRNNVIRDNPVSAAVNGFAGNGSIAVFAGTKYPTCERLLSNFRIEGNLIINPSVYGIVVRNTDQVVIRYNRIINPGANPFDGIYKGKPVSELHAAICLEAVSHALVTDNEIVFRNNYCQRAILTDSCTNVVTLKVERNREIHEENQNGKK